MSGLKLRTPTAVVEQAYRFLENGDTVSDSDLYAYEPEVVLDLHLLRKLAPVLNEWFAAREAHLDMGEPAGTDFRNLACVPAEKALATIIKEASE